MQKYKIISLSSKTVSTKFGDKEKLTVKFENPSQYFGVFAGPRTTNWKVGDEVELEKEWLVSREWQGKTYWDIKFPSQKGRFTDGNEQLNLLASRVAELEKRIAKYEAEELQKMESIAESINVKDIPF